MARYQTNFRKLLGLPQFANPDWGFLSDQIGLSGKVLEAWYNASVGSDEYIGDHKRSTADKIMAFLGIDDINELVVPANDEEECPRLSQELAPVAALAAA